VTPGDVRPAPVFRLTALWPPGRERLTGATLLVALAAALLASGPVLDARPGLGVALVGLLVMVAAFSSLRRPPDSRLRTTLVLAAPATGLLLVVALRDAGWIVALCLFFAVLTASVGLSRQRTLPGLVLGAWSLPLAGLAVPWWLAGRASGASGSARRAGPAVRGVLISVLLVLVFGALFAGADAVFLDVVEAVIPSVSLGDLPARLTVLVLVLGVALAAARLAAGPPAWDILSPAPGRPRPRAEWFVPVLTLDALFLAFGVLQLGVLFAGHDRVLQGSGVTYAEYARAGFGQLLAATALALGVVALAGRTAPRASALERRLAAIALGVLLVLTLVVVASALRRLGLYVEAYGATRPRLLAATVELWLGLVVLLVAAAGALHHRCWLPRAVVASGAWALLLLALANPDALIAERNVARFEQTGKLDVDYLAGLSAGVVPVLDQLPEPLRSCTLAGYVPGGDGGLASLNLDRARADAILTARPAQHSPDCGQR
jgi:hypothetical protein